MTTPRPMRMTLPETILLEAGADIHAAKAAQPEKHPQAPVRGNPHGIIDAHPRHGSDQGPQKSGAGNGIHGQFEDRRPETGR